MTASAQSRGERAEADRKFLVGLSRAFGGAIFFGLPLLMTMELWHFGFSLQPARIIQFMLFFLPLLVVLDRYSGFMATSTWAEDAIDALIGFGVGACAAALILATLGLIDLQAPLRENVGRVALLAVPGSFGAVLANSQFGAERGEKRAEEERRRRAGYPAQLFFMIVGALFLAFNIAPTDEVVLLAAQAPGESILATSLLTLALMHAFVYASGFRGAPQRHESEHGLALFLRFTVTGYVLALLISSYVLWTFGRFDGLDATVALAQTVILGLPSGLGAAAARLVL